MSALSNLRHKLEAQAGRERLEWIALQPGGQEALEPYAEAREANDEDHLAAVRSMLQTAEGRDALALLGERIIEYDAGLPPSPPVSLPPPLRREDRFRTRSESGSSREVPEAAENGHRTQEAEPPVPSSPAPPPWMELQRGPGDRWPG